MAEVLAYQALGAITGCDGIAELSQSGFDQQDLETVRGAIGQAVREGHSTVDEVVYRVGEILDTNPREMFSSSEELPVAA